MKLKPSPTYVHSLQLYVHVISSKGGIQSVTLERASLGGYDRDDSGMKEWQIRQDLAIVERGLMSSLPPAALKLVVKMMDELCMNNALWWVDVSSPHTRSALKVLKDRKVIYSTEDKNIYYVNPEMVRRGSVGSVLAQTTKLLEGMSRVHKDLIRDLDYRSIKFNMLDQIDLPNTRINE